MENKKIIFGISKKGMDVSWSGTSRLLVYAPCGKRISFFMQDIEEQIKEAGHEILVVQGDIKETLDSSAKVVFINEAVAQEDLELWQGDRVLIGVEAGRQSWDHGVLYTAGVKDGAEFVNFLGVPVEEEKQKLFLDDEAFFRVQGRDISTQPMDCERLLQLIRSSTARAGRDQEVFIVKKGADVDTLAGVFNSAVDWPRLSPAKAKAIYRNLIQEGVSLTLSEGGYELSSFERDKEYRVVVGRYDLIVCQEVGVRAPSDDKAWVRYKKRCAANERRGGRR